MLIGDFFRRLIRPWYWHLELDYDKNWDKKLNCLLDDMSDFEFLGYTLRINNVRVWVENYPYKFGFIYSINDVKARYQTRVRPSVKTMLRLKRFIDDEYHKYEKKAEERRVKNINEVLNRINCSKGKYE